MPLTSLETKHTETIRRILHEYLHDTPFMAYVFGSRTGRRYRPESDLDLLLDTEAKIPLSKLARLKGAFEDSDLPFRVDVVLRSEISPEFYQRIRQDLVPLCAFGGKRHHV
jgi:predicted nucleotidyltransferase